MNREHNIKILEETPNQWDVLIIGGGATGLGAAVDSASRGFKTLLVEQSDFAKGTSSRSTKLIHGGMRYLQQGNLGLVIEALRERGLLCQNAPHLVHHQPFLVPNYKWWEGPFYGTGIKVYDFLAGKFGLEPSKYLSKEEIQKKIPTLESTDLRGGMIYYDGQFDDARLAITLARTANDLGAVVLNYIRVTSLIKKKGKCVGVKVEDLESGKEYTLQSKAVINATGAFTDAIRHIDDKTSKPLIAASRGTHLVLPKKFLPGDEAILIPHTDDDRVVFLVPWLGKVLVGTTDLPIDDLTLEPTALQEEIDFLLKYVDAYLTKPAKPRDILSVFTGIRPLIKENEADSTSSLSREHRVIVSKSGLITIAGGKWTIYRQMAEDAVTKAIEVASLPKHPCITQTLPLRGFKKIKDYHDHLAAYGSDLDILDTIIKLEGKGFRKSLHRRLPYKQVEVLFAVRKEMARTVEDVLARRTRSLLLDAKASIEAAPLVASILSKELNKNASWEKEQIKSYTLLAENYLP